MALCFVSVGERKSFDNFYKNLFRHPLIYYRLLTPFNFDTKLNKLNVLIY